MHEFKGSMHLQQSMVVACSWKLHVRVYEMRTAVELSSPLHI